MPVLIYIYIYIYVPKLKTPSLRGGEGGYKSGLRVRGNKSCQITHLVILVHTQFYMVIRNCIQIRSYASNQLCISRAKRDARHTKGVIFIKR